MKNVVKEFKAKLSEEIAKLEAFVLGSGFTNAEIDEFNKNLPPADDINKFMKYFMAQDTQLVEVSNARDNIKNFRKTLEAELIHVPTKYLIAEEGSNVICPAGAGIDSGIYVKPNSRVILGVDDLKDAPKHSNLDLVVFKLDN